MTYREQLSQRIEQAFDAVERIVVGVDRNPEAKTAWEQGHADGYTCGYYDALTDARAAYDANAGSALRQVIEQVSDLEQSAYAHLRQVMAQPQMAARTWSEARHRHADLATARKVLERLVEWERNVERAVLATAQPP